MPIRPLRWDDFESIVRNYAELYAERERNPTLGMTLTGAPPTLPEEVTWFAGLYRATLEGRAIAVVAEEDGRAVGICTIASQGRDDPTSETAHLGVLGILVAEPYRDRGLGRAMMEAAIERARGRFEIVRLIVFASNARARHLYASLGFETVGRLPANVRRGGVYHDEETMSLDLRRPPAGARGANR